MRTRDRSREQVLVPWPAPPLESRERAEVRVRVAHGDGLEPVGRAGDGRGRPARRVGLVGAVHQPRRYRRRGHAGPGRCPARSTCPDQSGSARLYATAHGIYVPSINGRRVDDTVLAPGWTSYEHRLRYHVYDVTDLVQPGDNTVEALLGNGWYRGRLGYTERAGAVRRPARRCSPSSRSPPPTARVHVLATDGTWRARESEIVADDLYDGQTTDLRLRDASAPTVGCRGASTRISSRLVAAGRPADPADGVLPARRVWTSPSGRTLVDFGQNAVGWVRLRVRGLPAGTEVVVRHAEVLEDGELATRPLRTAERHRHLALVRAG